MCVLCISGEGLLQAHTHILALLQSLRPLPPTCGDHTDDGAHQPSHWTNYGLIHLILIHSFFPNAISCARLDSSAGHTDSPQTAIVSFSSSRLITYLVRKLLIIMKFHCQLNLLKWSRCLKL